MQPFRVFQASGISTDCDRCGGRVDLLKGGVCTQCRRILCYRHLHGGWVRRVIADLRNESICLECRAGRGASTGAAVDANAR